MMIKIILFVGRHKNLLLSYLICVKQYKFMAVYLSFSINFCLYDHILCVFKFLGNLLTIGSLVQT